MKNHRSRTQSGAIISIITIILISGCSNIRSVDRKNPESVINATVSAIDNNQWEIIYNLLPKGQQNAITSNIRNYYPGDKVAEYMKLLFASGDKIKSCKRKARMTQYSDDIVSYRISTIFDNELKTTANGYVSFYKGTDNRWYIDRINIYGNI